MEWYYADGGQRVGPVTSADFETLVRNGVIKPDTLVWRQGMANWQAYAAVAGGGMPAAPAALPTAGVAVETGRTLEGAAQPGQFVYGGFWLRFLAKILDGLVITVAAMVLNMIFAAILLGSANYFTVHADEVNIVPFLLFQGVSMVANIALALAYLIFFIRKFDATPGKMALGLKLVRADGSSLSTGRIVGRYFAEWISGMILLIGYIIAGFDDQKRALHDHICDTRVIKAR